MMNEELRVQQILNGKHHEPELELLFTLKPGMDRNRFIFQITNELFLHQCSLPQQMERFLNLMT